MAIPSNYIDKITKGNDSRMISPAADMVRVNNDNFNGADLDEVLDDVAQAISEASSGAVSVTTNQDGTFTIHVGETDYSINLNHTHEGMAKLVKCTEATLPQTMADDTIYVQVDNATTPTEIEKLYLFGLEFAGGGLPAGTPQITSPKSTIPFNLGSAYGQGGATGTVQVKGKNLTANSSLTVSVGSGFSLSYGQQSGSSITISAADAAIGADVDVFATAYGTSGALLITSQTDNINHSVELTSDVSEDLLAVKLTGMQWLQTDYCPNANTQIEMTCMFVSNSNTGASNYKGLTFLYAKTDNGKFYRMYHGGNGTNLIHVPQTGTAILIVTSANLGTPNSVINIDNVAGSFSFAPGGSNLSSQTFTKRTATSPYALEIGRGTYDSSAAPDTTLYGAYDLVIYSLVIKEAGTVVRNYQPMSYNGVPGLYDTVNNNFISSETSDELVAIQNS